MAIEPPIDTATKPSTVGRRQFLKVGGTVAVAGVPVIASLRPLPALAQSPPPQTEPPPGQSESETETPSGSETETPSGSETETPSGSETETPTETTSVAGTETTTPTSGATTPTAVQSSPTTAGTPTPTTAGGVSGDMPDTGIDVATLLTLSGGAIAAGASSIWAARRLPGSGDTSERAADGPGELPPPTE